MRAAKRSRWVSVIYAVTAVERARARARGEGRILKYPRRLRAPRERSRDGGAFMPRVKVLLSRRPRERTIRARGPYIISGRKVTSLLIKSIVIRGARCRAGARTRRIARPTVCKG